LTKMGLIGIKVWIYKGEVLTTVKRDAKSEADRSKVRDNIPQRRERPSRPDRDDDKGGFDRPYQSRDNRGGGRPGGDNRGGGRGGFNNRNDRNAPAPQPTSYGNRKVGAPRPQRPQKPVETPVDTAAGTEGGNNDVNT
jgi:hypothetical protein